MGEGHSMYIITEQAGDLWPSWSFHWLEGTRATRPNASRAGVVVYMAASGVNWTRHPGTRPWHGRQMSENDEELQAARAIVKTWCCKAGESRDLCVAPWCVSTPHIRGRASGRGTIRLQQHS